MLMFFKKWAVLSTTTTTTACMSICRFSLKHGKKLYWILTPLTLKKNKLKINLLPWNFVWPLSVLQLVAACILVYFLKKIMKIFASFIHDALCCILIVHFYTSIHIEYIILHELQVVMDSWIEDLYLIFSHEVNLLLQQFLLTLQSLSVKEYLNMSAVHW